MRMLWIIISLFIVNFSLTSCSTLFTSSSAPVEPVPVAEPVNVVENQQTNMGEPLPPGSPPQMHSTNDLSGASFGGMSSADKNRLAHALDATPGKSTRWTNVNTGVSYTVTPIRKVVVNNNHLCRTYTSTASRNGQKQEFNGTACITDDGNWHNVSGS